MFNIEYDVTPQISQLGLEESVRQISDDLKIPMEDIIVKRKDETRDTAKFKGNPVQYDFSGTFLEYVLYALHEGRPGYESIATLAANGHIKTEMSPEQVLGMYGFEDRDGNGVPDKYEMTSDINHDGIDDYYERDNDGNGVPDRYE